MNALQFIKKNQNKTQTDTHTHTNNHIHNQLLYMWSGCERKYNAHYTYLFAQRLICKGTIPRPSVLFGFKGSGQVVTSLIDIDMARMKVHVLLLPPLLLLLLDLGPILGASNLNLNNNFRNMQVRLRTNDTGGKVTRPIREGRVEVSFDYGATWGTICSSSWTKREGNVVCRQLGLGYASTAVSSTKHGNSKTHPWGMVGTRCRGTERALAECHRESRYPLMCSATNRNVSTVACVSKSPDLELGLRDIEQTAYLASVPMNELTCAMEENCVSADAYIIRRTNPRGVRKLLRFSLRASNVGNADVSPYANYKDWVWHQCHRHYHSMNVFATFDVYNQRYQKVAQGHKASFCLEDSQCNPGVTRKYTCGNTTQGKFPHAILSTFK